MAPVVDAAGSVEVAVVAVKHRNPAHLTRIFIMLAVVGIVINLDGGAVPAALKAIEEEFELSSAEVGLLGSLVYFGIAAGSLVVGPLLRVVSPIRATQVTVALNMGATCAFGLSPNAAVLLVFRFLIGFLQAIPAVYFPVWVDEFGPEASRTVWMAVIQSGAPLGIMIGYVLAGALTSSDDSIDAAVDGWRIPFLLQSGVLTALLFGFALVPKDLYDLPPEAQQRASVREASARMEREGNAEAAADAADEASTLTTGALDAPAARSEGNLSLSAEERRRTLSGGAPSPFGRGRAVSVSTSIAALTPAQLAHLPGDTPRGAAIVEGRERLTSVAEMLMRGPSSAPSGGVGSMRKADSAAAVAADADAEVGGAGGAATDAADAADAAGGSASGGAASGGAGGASLLWQLLTCRVYVCTTLALSALFFVVTGIQFWVTLYLEKYLEVWPVFAVTSITAPLLGVFAGGWFVDKLGGYQGKQGIARTLKCCCCFAFLAGASAILATLVTPGPAALPLVITCIALTLVFGGAVIPSGTGVLIAAPPFATRQLASAGSMLTFQLLGYALSPLISATVPPLFASEDVEKLKLGFRIVMCWGVLGMVSLALGWRFAVQDALRAEGPPDAKVELRPAPTEHSTALAVDTTPAI